MRREATAGAPDALPRGHGLTLFLARGLPAWLAVLSALTPAGPPRAPDPAPGEPPAPLGPAVRWELTAVLAGMVLACTQPREGGDGACPQPAR